VSALHRAWAEDDGHQLWTDEAALLESFGMPVRSVVAQHPNPKLTTESDLRVMHTLLQGDG
jgi:2-C-methyl-D-erythritol 4-phosphate cytidylyltransferase